MPVLNPLLALLKPLKTTWLSLLFSLLLLAPAYAQTTVVKEDTMAVDTTAARDDSYRLEVGYTTLSSISGQVRKVFDTRGLAEELPDVVENLKAIQYTLKQKGQVVDIKQLQMCQLMLTTIQDELGEWRSELAEANKQLAAMQGRLKSIAQPPARAANADATTLALERSDSALWARRQRIGGLLEKRYLKVKQLQTQVAASYIQGMELQDEVGDQMRRYSRTSAKLNYPPLWEAESVPPAPADPKARKAGQYRREIISFYFAHNWDNWAYMALIGLVFYGWVSFNYRRAKAEGLVITEPFRYLRPGPVAVTLVVMFTLAPALELHPPPIYLALLQLLLLVALTSVFARSWSRRLFLYWLGLVAFFVWLSVTNANATTGLGARWGLLGLNALAVGIGAWLLWRLRQTLAQMRFLIPVTWLFIGLNGLAIICNVVGRLSLAKMFSTAAIFGLTQGIGMAVFIESFTEAFHLQILCSRGSAGAASAFDYDKIEPQLMRLLTVLAGALWLVVFTSNLNIYNIIYGIFDHFLTTPHLIGSTEFTFGNILLFFLILYISALLQRYIGYFFGEVGDDDSEARKRGSWLVALRLLLVLVGFALATAATGLPLSKIAIVFGALSVGIGLGLQSIVNNLVSGIILIFERPFHVGDFIEVAGKAGRVHDIGIRSSKLTSVTGSEIIVPNGDMLSNHVINWTRTNDHIRTDLSLKLAPGTDLQTDLQKARELIQEEIKTSPYTMHNLPPEILLSSINGQVYELKVLFWITNIRQEQLTKSEILAGIYRRFVAQGLTLS